MLRTADLMDWFSTEAANLSPSVSFSMDTLPEGEPHRACSVRVTGGLGMELEDALDRPTFQLLTRGVSGRDAEVISLALDALWLDFRPAFYIGAFRVIGKGRFGGPPAFVAEDANELYPGRILRSATYWCRIAR